MLAKSRTKVNVNPQPGDMLVVQCPYHVFWSWLFVDVPQRRYLACTNTDNNIRGVILSLLGDIWSLDLHVRLITNIVSYKSHKLKRYAFSVGQLCHWHYKPWHFVFHHQLKHAELCRRRSGWTFFKSLCSALHFQTFWGVVFSYCQWKHFLILQLHYKKIKK